MLIVKEKGCFLFVLVLVILFVFNLASLRVKLDVKQYKIFVYGGVFLEKAETCIGVFLKPVHTYVHQYIWAPLPHCESSINMCDIKLAIWNVHLPIKQKSFPYDTIINTHHLVTDRFSYYIRVLSCWHFFVIFPDITPEMPVLRLMLLILGLS